MATDAKPMTTEDLLAMPDDGVERRPIRGELRERILTTRGVPHCLVTQNFSLVLGTWLKQQPRPRGLVLSGEVRVRLQAEPLTTVGVDLTYLSAELAKKTSSRAKFVDGVPTLVIEVLSPSDVSEDIGEKVQDYLDAGVPHVWVAEPTFETVTIYRPRPCP